MKMSVMLLLNFEGKGPGFLGAFVASKFLKKRIYGNFDNFFSVFVCCALRRAYFESPNSLRFLQYTAKVRLYFCAQKKIFAHFFVNQL